MVWYGIPKPGGGDVGVRPLEDRHGLAQRGLAPLRIRPRHMAIERAMRPFLGPQVQRHRRGEQPPGGGGDQAGQARVADDRLQGGGIVLAEGGRDVHGRGSWLGLEVAPRLAY